MKYLIINADDFGLHKDINAGIIKGFREGCITSTSLMCSAPAFEDAVALAKANPALGIGLHLTLVGGVQPLLPLEKVPSLVDGKGFFLSDYIQFIKKFISLGISKSEIKDELSAQIERGLATGLKITHVDSHQHLHVLPGITEIVADLCVEYGIEYVRISAEAISWTGGYEANLGRKVGRFGLTLCSEMAKWKLKRAGLKSPEHFYGMLAGGNLNAALVRKIIEDLPDGVSEIMTHPGLNSRVLRELYPWGYHWEEELAAFLSDENKNEITARGISLINFGGLDYAK